MARFNHEDGAALKEKELRLALVCGGGLSLAVYIHGVTKEILKLIRASAAYHAEPDLEKRRRLGYRDIKSSENRESDTEEIYFEVLKALGDNLDLRVIVDVIGGASAGGINGIFLARSLAHDLDDDHLREVWLKQADVAELRVGDGKPVAWHKWLIKPILRMLPRDSLRGIGGHTDASGKLAALLPLRGARPPFDGEKLLAALHDAIDDMGSVSPGGPSLMPDGHKLELFVTITDFFGYAQYIPLDDPPMIEEREYRHSLRFEYQRWPDGDEITEFSDRDVAALAFAARATSSYPGAFPPAQIGEVDRLYAARQIEWVGREEFLERSFKPYYRTGMDPLKTSFMDGSVLNNKPFAETIEAIKGRPAYRQVDRRLVYIDPHPLPPPPPPTGAVPNFWSSLKAALSDIPRNEPIHDDLAWIEGFNLRVRRAKTIIEAARPEIDGLVSSVARGRLDARHITADRITAWRERANDRAEKEVGFAYEGYARLKLTSVLENIASLICVVCGHAERSQEGGWVSSVLTAWADRRHIRPVDARMPLLRRGLSRPPIWVEFLRSFDVGFRRRQIRFTIESLNHLYGSLDDPSYVEVTTARLDKLKGHFYDILDNLRDLDEPDFINAGTAARIRGLFGEEIPVAGAAAETDADALANFAVANADRIESALDELARDMNLAGRSQEADRIFAEFAGDPGARMVRRELLVDYLGFAFWDIMTFIITSWRDHGEFDEIRVTRISPDDCEIIRPGGAAATLKGTALGHFGAFFSRRDRENDYLWGRLHGVDRLLDILCSAADGEVPGLKLKALAMKKRAFEKILETERRHLTHSRRLFETLSKEIDRIETGEETGEETSDQT